MQTLHVEDAEIKVVCELVAYFAKFKTRSLLNAGGLKSQISDASGAAAQTQLMQPFSCCCILRRVTTCEKNQIEIWSKHNTHKNIPVQ